MKEINSTILGEKGKMLPRLSHKIMGGLLLATLMATGAMAQDAAVVTEAVKETVNKGDTAFIIACTMVVLLMTIPGLPLFYGGLIRAKNMLSMLMQVSVTVVIGMIIYVMWGYSLSFTDSPLGAFIGGGDRLFLKGITIDSMSATYSEGVMLPEFLYMTFQMTFAAITPAVVLGAITERFKFSAVVIFAVLWPLLSYYPIAHMVWFGSGLIYNWGALDFAGGTVVHINAGIGALIACLIVGPRTGYNNSPSAPHSLVLTYIGAGLLWVGWIGFNGGSNLEANGMTALVILNTFLCAAAASLSWAGTEWIINKKPSLLGLASGLIAGLVAITPACGNSGPMGAIILGLIVSPLCIYFCAKVKHMFKYDDTLDVFGIHGVGGIVGAIATGVLASPLLGGSAPDGYTMAGQVITQIKASLVSMVWAGVATAIVLYIIKFTVGLRVSEDAEEEGLDTAEHGERAYHI